MGTIEQFTSDLRDIQERVRSAAVVWENAREQDKSQAQSEYRQAAAALKEVMLRVTGEGLKLYFMENAVRRELSGLMQFERDRRGVSLQRFFRVTCANGTWKFEELAELTAYR